MPLSDHEQRLLEQMERALYAEDPKFADSLRKSRRPTLDRKRMALGVVGVLAGLAILVAGVATSQPLIGVVGFLATVAGAFLTYQAFTAGAGEQGQAATGEAPTARPGAAKSSRRPSANTDAGFMDRLEDRWRRRREQDGGQQF